jgi:hypothetical protein
VKSVRQQVTAATIIVLMLLALAQLVAGAEPIRMTVKPGLIELRLNPVAPVGADVSWDSRTPLALDYRTYEMGNVLVTYATSGQIVVISDVIDWEAKQRTKTTWIVEVEGFKPDPTPDPDPTPLPIPTGLAGEVYRLAKAINEPAKAIKYADNFAAVSSMIGAGAIVTVEQARDKILELNKPLATNSGTWKAVGVFVAQQMSAQATLSEIKNIFDSVALGLRVAGKI